MRTLFTTVEYGIYFGCMPDAKRAHLTSIYLNILTRCACVFPSSPSGCRNTLHAARNSARPLLTHQMHPFISVASNQKKLNTRWENRQQTGNTKTPQQSAMLDHHFTLTNNKYIVNQIIKYIVN